MATRTWMNPGVKITTVYHLLKYAARKGASGVVMRRICCARGHWHAMPIGFLMSMQFRSVINEVESGRIYTAVKKTINPNKLCLPNAATNRPPLGGPVQ